jgi:hypothetical protein
MNYLLKSAEERPEQQQTIDPKSTRNQTPNLRSKPYRLRTWVTSLVYQSSNIFIVDVCTLTNITKFQYIKQKNAKK